jgi:hypothetical protein
MSNSKQIIDALIQEDLYTAKKLISEDLVARMGNALENKLVYFGPTLFGEGAKPDFLDLDKDGDKKESMKKAAKQSKKPPQEEEELDEVKLSKPETKEKERLVKGMKPKEKEFEKKYPGKGKEVMYATATKKAQEKK